MMTSERMTREYYHAANPVVTKNLLKLWVFVAFAAVLA